LVPKHVEHYQEESDKEEEGEEVPRHEEVYQPSPSATTLTWFQSMWSITEKSPTRRRKGRRYPDTKKHIKPPLPTTLTWFQSLWSMTELKLTMRRRRGSRYPYMKKHINPYSLPTKLTWFQSLWSMIE
jgi:hypothetical protein